MNLLLTSCRHFYACSIPHRRFRTPVGSINVPPASFLESVGQRERRNRLFSPSLQKPIIMEAENTLTITKQISDELFFKEEFRRLREAFAVTKDVTDPMNYLCNSLSKLAEMMRALELPWERYIPILFRSFAIYMRYPDENVSSRKAYQLTALLMDSITYLSQNGKQIHDLRVFFEQQVGELNELLSARRSESDLIEDNN